MGEDEHELVYGLPCKEQGDERLFGMSRMRKWSDGVLEYWSIGRIRHKVNSFLTHYSVTPVLHYFNSITPSSQLGA